MLPVDFIGRNRMLSGQKDEHGNALDDIITLPTFTNNAVCVSRWRLTDEERQQLLVSRGIWVWIFYPIMPAIRLTSINPIEWTSLNSCPVECKLLHQSESECLTFWELTDDEVELIDATGCFWCIIQSGRTQPPVGFQLHSPFEGQ